mmetsp:Transcript_47455/g.75013  ORF Transcript_47455/g.75013 Transcript_47455/m.75013 type:complete len:429 (-) Transcript_47455:100-1386(-)|eukprot:CAMPEP_0169114074 /NCGR_PEP_ID=MMETSP1015-20121227/28548_1 /TAXON_ID=342587 /ORGANISM="Karlodinium micrum, Strain CCMP2283" /LENGTH=428 /DNA_ID=CAMNT_0009176301 /DNA_START=60 /DNA_END=1346 /DNA_ORIENTATION=-
MSHALWALLPFFLIHSLAVRPQEETRFTSNWGTPGTSWLELGDASQGNASHEDTRALAVGHSAGLQHEASSKRLNTQASLASAGYALAQFALSESGREPQNGTVLANPTLQDKEPPENKASNGGLGDNSENQHASNEEHAHPKATHSGAGKQHEEHQVAKKDGTTAVQAHAEKANLADASKAPQSQVSEHQREREEDEIQERLDNTDAVIATDVEDGNEVEQEMDDIIVDVEEIEREGGKVLRKLKKFWGEEGFRHVALNLAVYFAGVFVSLGLYATCFRHRDVKQEQEFRYGACECLGDGRVCICGLCCPAIRWADTISEEKGGFLDFSSALLVMMGLGFMCLCPYSGLIAWIGIVFVGVYYRQRIRLRYGLEADTVQSYIEDIFVWCCCAWCAICQEARQVDEETTEEEVRVAADPKQSRSMSTSW